MKSAKKKRSKEDEWTKGYACACAIVANLEGFTKQGAELAREGGFNLQSFIDACVEQCDIDNLRLDGLK